MIPVYNVDGTRNESGSILEVVDVVINYKGHGERTLLAVTGLGNKDVILGYTWLREHNPEINWQTQEIKLSRCPNRCRECHREVREEKTPKINHLHAFRRMLSSPVQTLPVSAGEDIAGAGDSPEAFSAEDEFSEGEEDYTGPDALEEGDRLLATSYRAAVVEKRVDDETARLRAALDARARRLESLLGIERPAEHKIATASTASQQITDTHAQLEKYCALALRSSLPHVF